MQVERWCTRLGASPEVDASRPAQAHSDGAVGVRGARRLLTQRRLQVVLGLIWLLDAGLQFQPYMFSRGFVADFLAMNDMFQPHVIGVAIKKITEFLVPHAAAWNALFATTQLAVGVGLLFRRTVKPALLLSFGWVLGVWVVGEGLGGLLTPIMGSPLAGFPGPVLIYGLVGLVLWPTRRLERETVASAGPLGAQGTRVLWAALWFGMSIEQLRPGPGLSPSSVMTVIVSMNKPGEPTWLVHLDKVATTAISSIGSPLVLVLALVEVTIGVLVLRRHQVKAALWAAIVLSVLFWVVGQNFGGILAGNATDPSAGPLYVLLAFSLYPLGTNRQGEEASEATAPAPAETAPTELTA
ncbi:MAG: hypothetical protein M0T80_15500 [Actinomycetota bacterium]|jgi:hypothetical protein|nr:hypothetical protein [Actinomycetota bacterium]